MNKEEQGKELEAKYIGMAMRAGQLQDEYMSLPVDADPAKIEAIEQEMLSIQKETINIVQEMLDAEESEDHRQVYEVLLNAMKEAYKDSIELVEGE